MGITWGCWMHDSGLVRDGGDSGSALAGLCLYSDAMNLAMWIPKGEGKMAELFHARIVLPYLDQVTVVTNTELKDMMYPTCNHAAANAIFLSNVRPRLQRL
jgi:hypothetical protein